MSPKFDWRIFFLIFTLFPCCFYYILIKVLQQAFLQDLLTNSVKTHKKPKTLFLLLLKTVKKSFGNLNIFVNDSGLTSWLISQVAVVMKLFWAYLTGPIPIYFFYIKYQKNVLDIQCRKFILFICIIQQPLYKLKLYITFFYTKC